MHADEAVRGGAPPEARADDGGCRGALGLRLRTDRRARAYDPQLHAFWRIAADAGVVRWETSDKGTVFQTLHSERAPFELTGLQVELVGGNSVGVAQQAQIQFDDLNLPAAE